MALTTTNVYDYIFSSRQGQWDETTNLCRAYLNVLLFNENEEIPEDISKEMNENQNQSSGHSMSFGIANSKMEQFEFNEELHGDPNELFNKFDLTEIEMNNKCLNEIKDYILEHKIDINKQNENGTTFLNFAVDNDKYELTKLLINKFNANVRSRSTFVRTISCGLSYYLFALFISFILIDAGGGTVDNMKRREIFHPTGDALGSTYIDEFIKQDSHSYYQLLNNFTPRKHPFYNKYNEDNDNIKQERVLADGATLGAKGGTQSGAKELLY